MKQYMPTYYINCFSLFVNFSLRLQLKILELLFISFMTINPCFIRLQLSYPFYDFCFILFLIIYSNLLGKILCSIKFIV